MGRGLKCEGLLAGGGGGAGGAGTFMGMPSFLHRKRILIVISVVSDETAMACSYADSACNGFPQCSITYVFLVQSH